MAPKKASKKAAKVLLPDQPKPSRWPLLRDYLTSSGVFRLRPIRWAQGATYLMNPYTAGIVAFFSVKVANFTSMLAGGMPDLSQKFTPHAALRPFFVEAYTLIQDKGNWIGWAETQDGTRDYFEFTVRSPKSPRRIWEASELDGWETYFRNRVETFERMHKLLSAIGVPERELVYVALDGDRTISLAEAELIETYADDRHRVGAL